jgi:hypothetical protein
LSLVVLPPLGWHKEEGLAVERVVGAKCKLDLEGCPQQRHAVGGSMSGQDSGGERLVGSWGGEDGGGGGGGRA